MLKNERSGRGGKGVRGKPSDYSDNLTIKKSENSKGGNSMFSTGVLLTAGLTIATALVDKILDESGYQWLGTTLRILIPLAGMALGVYFLDTNQILRWLR